MKYDYQILNNTKAIIEIIPETENEKELFNNMQENNPDDDTLRYYYSKGLERAKQSAVILGIDEFEKFPTKAIIYYRLAKGMGSF